MSAFISGDEVKHVTVEKCHEGEGILHCKEYLGDYDRKSPGLKFIHDDVMEVGASVGEHEHTNDEELYFFIEGTGTMIMDGKSQPVKAGDCVITGDSHTHGLVNTGDRPLRFIVVCAGWGERHD